MFFGLSTHGLCLQASRQLDPCIPFMAHNRAEAAVRVGICPIFISMPQGEFGSRGFILFPEEVPIGTIEVRSLSAACRIHLEYPNVATRHRNGMPATAWKKYVKTYSLKNLPPSVYSGTFLFSGLPVILLINAKHDMLIAPAPFLWGRRSLVVRR